MSSKLFLSVVFIFSLLLASTAFAGENNPVLAKVGNYVVRQSDLDRLISYYPTDKQKFLNANPQRKLTLLKRLVDVKVISDIAKKEGFDQKPEIKELMRLTMDNVLTSEYLMKSVEAGIKVTDADMKQYYDLNKSKFVVPEEAHARHILIRVAPGATVKEREKARAKAEDILAKLKKGADFAKLAEQYSEDPVTKSHGGDLGYFPKGRMVKSFEDAVFSLKPGEVSGIVESRFGYHIIKLEDIRKSRTKTLEEVKDVIREQLKKDMSKRRTTEFIKKALKDAGAEVYADKVVPPAAKKEDTGK